MLFLTAIIGFLFYKLANPFVAAWVGEDLVLGLAIVFAISVNSMFWIIKNPIDIFKEAYGIFWDVYAPVIEAVINLVFSIVLALKFGLVGIIIGTIISNTCITFFWKPYVLFKNVFKEKLIKFFVITAKYMGIALVRCSNNLFHNGICRISVCKQICTISNVICSLWNYFIYNFYGMLYV